MRTSMDLCHIRACHSRKEMRVRGDIFFIPYTRTYIPATGTYIPFHGIYIPAFGTENLWEQAATGYQTRCQP